MAGGVALSAKFRRTGQVVLCYFGDGASCEGEFFETLNMAMLWQVPLVFVCENNGVAISVPTEKSQATPGHRRPRARLRHAVARSSTATTCSRSAARSARASSARARGGGPTFVECKTLRWEHHSAFSSGGKDAGRAPCAARAGRPDRPLAQGARRLGRRDTGALDAIDDEARAWAKDVRAQAEAAPLPAPDSIYEDIFAP